MNTPTDIAQIAEELLVVLTSSSESEGQETARALRRLWAADGCPIDEIAIEVYNFGCQIPRSTAQKFFLIEGMDEEFPDAAEILREALTAV